MTAFHTTWDAWLGFAAAILCILLVLHATWRVFKSAGSERALSLENFWTHLAFWEVAGAILIAATAIFGLYFSQRARPMPPRLPTAAEQEYLERSMNQAPRSTDEEIRADMEKKKAEAVPHSGKSLQERSDDSNRLMEEAIERWEDKE